MKPKDIALIVVIGVIAFVISLTISQTIFKTSVHETKVEVVQPITADFEEPDARYFNKDAFDPTQPVQIDGNANPDPFKEQ